MASISRWMADEVTKSPELDQIFRDVVPGVDMTTAGGFLQFAFVQVGCIVVGFAAATLVAGWASDETSGRLEMLLATPLGHGSWAILSGLGVYAAIAALTVILALAVGIGAASAGSNALTPMGGSATLGLYAAAVAGVGFAIGGVFRTSIAAETVALLVFATFLIDLLAPALNLPEWVHQLALTAHLGRPMVGEWDGAGIAACVLLAVGGLLTGGWGMRRRDVAR
jgi:ABC-2 type transport system permease protein